MAERRDPQLTSLGLALMVAAGITLPKLLVSVTQIALDVRFLDARIAPEVAMIGLACLVIVAGLVAGWLIAAPAR